MEQTMITRTEIINHLIKKYGYKTYLEIGVGDPRENLCLIECEKKTGVDPYFDFNDLMSHEEEVLFEISRNVKFRLTSDEFFEYLRPDAKFDVIFIDGFHTEEQCDKDIQNSLLHLSEGGVVVVHDTNPYTKEYAVGREDYIPGQAWTGDVYKSIAKLKIMGIPYVTYGGDQGVTVIKKPENFVYNKNVARIYFPYEHFESNRTEFLNMRNEEEFLKEI